MAALCRPALQGGAGLGVLLSIVLTRESPQMTHGQFIAQEEVTLFQTPNGCSAIRFGRQLIFSSNDRRLLAARLEDFRATLAKIIDAALTCARHPRSPTGRIAANAGHS